VERKTLDPGIRRDDEQFGIAIGKAPDERTRDIDSKCLHHIS
jgi:hypothetical protein